LPYIEKVIVKQFLFMLFTLSDIPGPGTGSVKIRTDNISSFSRFFKRERCRPGTEESFFPKTADFLPQIGFIFKIKFIFDLQSDGKQTKLYCPR